MSRPLRLEFEGALYHITARGDNGAPTYDDFVANGAARAKEALAVAGAACLKKIETEIFKP